MVKNFFVLKVLFSFHTFILLFVVIGFQPSFADPRKICDKIARKVEQIDNLPENILTSIALVEAGRINRDGSKNPWPWSLNHAGKSLFFNNKEDAINYLKKHVSPDFKNIDVGCMQINVKWHRENFKSFSSMINPRTNIEYAAKFLKRLKQIHGSWEDAIKHYHSSTPKLHQKYYAKVKRAWSEKKYRRKESSTVAVAESSMLYTKQTTNEDIFFGLSEKKNLDENKQGMLKKTSERGMDVDNQIYLNAVLIENNKMYDEAELKRYIKYKSAFLGKNVDMILLFRKEFLNN